MTKNVKRYLALKKAFDEEEDEARQSELEDEMNELYFELNNDEIEYLEVKGAL